LNRDPGPTKILPSMMAFVGTAQRIAGGMRGRFEAACHGLAPSAAAVGPR